MNIHFEKDIKDSFVICQLEDVLLPANKCERLTYHRIIFVEQAQGDIEIDGTVIAFNGPKLFLVGKGQLCNYLNASLIRGYQLSFGDCFWEKTPASASNCKAVLFNNAAENQWLTVPDVETFKGLEFLFSTLQNEFSASDYVNKLDTLAAYLKIIMIKIANINAESGAGFDSFERQFYRQFLELVSEQFYLEHEVSAYALELGVSTRQLSDICKHSCGKGAKDIIIGQLTAEAKRSLQFSAKPVKEIAYQLRFSSPEQFSHFFKKNTMMSPKNYRTQFVNFGR